MSMLALFAQTNPKSVAFIQRLATHFDASRHPQQGDREATNTLLMWGGGKDSTLALAVLTALSELIPLKLQVVTMDNPGITKGTLDNILNISRSLKFQHEFWHFTQPVVSLHSNDAEWHALYRILYSASGHNPRFMCIACNWSSLVVEYSALHRHRASILATGNPSWELDQFKQWIANICALCPSLQNNLCEEQLAYYEAWREIYVALIHDLWPDISEAHAMIKRYLYDRPSRTKPLCVTHINVLGDSLIQLNAREYEGVLREIGWRLPSDIMGSTESDCGLTAVISTLNIERHGVREHLTHLDEANSRFSPLPEMYERAKQWIVEGRAQREGTQWLNDHLGPLVEQRTSVHQSTVLSALISQLHRIR